MFLSVFSRKPRIDNVGKFVIIRTSQRLNNFYYMNSHKAKARLAAILKQLQRDCRFKSVAEMSRAIGIPEQRLRGYVRGDNTAQQGSLMRIERYMGLKEGELWDRLYLDDDVRSAGELLPLFKSLPDAEKKKFVQKAMELI